MHEDVLGNKRKLRRNQEKSTVGVENRCMRALSGRFLEVADRPERFFRPLVFSICIVVLAFLGQPAATGLSHDCGRPDASLYSAIPVRTIASKASRIE